MQSTKNSMHVFYIFKKLLHVSFRKHEFINSTMAKTKSQTNTFYHWHLLLSLYVERLATK